MSVEKGALAAFKAPPRDLDIDLQVAEGVLRLESRALSTLADSLDENFSKAVALLIATKGRVIITGMGKSGHVGRKIAATLASTGTPSFFVHPGEASHGDLGMIMKGDTVIMLSNSGKAAELREVIYYTRRFEIPVIAITSERQSPLGEGADVVLLLPWQPEAGSLGLAPTTSTTMQMALGDALAVALFERRGFCADDFKNFHPGGKLGSALMRVSEIMHKEDQIPLVSEDAKMDTALLQMSSKSLGCVGVLDNNCRLTGIITDGDLRRHMGPQLLSQSVKDVMTKAPHTISPRALVAEAIAQMTEGEKKITQLFVVENGHPVGVLHIHDALRAGVK